MPVCVVKQLNFSEHMCIIITAYHYSYNIGCYSMSHSVIVPALVMDASEEKLWFWRAYIYILVG